MIGKVVAQLRKEREWTQAELGQRCGVGQNYVSQIESGAFEPTFATVSKLAKAFGMKRHEFVRLVDEAEIPVQPAAA